MSYSICTGFEDWNDTAETKHISNMNICISQSAVGQRVSTQKNHSKFAQDFSQNVIWPWGQCDRTSNHLSRVWQSTILQKANNEGWRNTNTVSHTYQDAKTNLWSDSKEQEGMCYLRVNLRNRDRHHKVCCRWYLVVRITFLVDLALGHGHALTTVSISAPAEGIYAIQRLEACSFITHTEDK